MGCFLTFSMSYMQVRETLIGKGEPAVCKVSSLWVSTKQSPCLAREDTDRFLCYVCLFFKQWGVFSLSMSGTVMKERPSF